MAHELVPEVGLPNALVAIPKSFERKLRHNAMRHFVEPSQEVVSKLT